MAYRKKITPPAELAAFITAHRNTVAYAPEAPSLVLPAEVSTAYPELGPGTYVVNADGTLTPQETR